MNDKPHYLGHRERFREKFAIDEGRSMADYEIMEGYLMSVIPRKDVKPLAKDLLARFKSLSGIVNASVKDLTSVKGISEATAFHIKMAKAFVIRMTWRSLQSGRDITIAGTEAAIDFCRMNMAHLDVEEFRIFYIDTQLKLMSEEVMQRGTIDQVAIHPREVLMAAVNRGCRGIILVHNHPSGDVKPSKADVAITNQIAEALDTVDIEVFDHIIISKYEHFSFMDHNLIKKKER